MEPQKSANLVDMMSPEEQERVGRREQLRSNKVTSEWMAMSELGFYYGWGAIRDMIDDVISLDQATLLIQGARKLHSSHVYDQAVATLAGNSTKKGAFNKMMNHYIKDMKDVA